MTGQKRTRTNLRAAAVPRSTPAKPAVGTTAQRTGTNTTVPLDFGIWAKVKSWCAHATAETGTKHEIGPVGAVLYGLLVSEDDDTAFLREQVSAYVNEQITK